MSGYLSQGMATFLLIGTGAGDRIFYDVTCSRPTPIPRMGRKGAVVRCGGWNWEPSRVKRDDPGRYGR